MTVAGLVSNVCIIVDDTCDIAILAGNVVCLVVYNKRVIVNDVAILAELIEYGIMYNMVILDETVFR